MKTQLEKIESKLLNMNETSLIKVYNNYCSDINMNEQIYANDADIINVLCRGNCMRAINMAKFGNYSASHNWVKLDGLANLESSNDAIELMQISDLANYINDNK